MSEEFQFTLYRVSDGVAGLKLPEEKLNEIASRWWDEDFGDLPQKDIQTNYDNLRRGFIDIIGKYTVDGHELYVWAQGGFPPLILLTSEW